MDCGLPGDAREHPVAPTLAVNLDKLLCGERERGGGGRSSLSNFSCSPVRVAPAVADHRTPFWRGAACSLYANGKRDCVIPSFPRFARANHRHDHRNANASGDRVIPGTRDVRTSRVERQLKQSGVPELAQARTYSRNYRISLEREFAERYYRFRSYRHQSRERSHRGRGASRPVHGVATRPCHSKGTMRPCQIRRGDPS